MTLNEVDYLDSLASLIQSVEISHEQNLGFPEEKNSINKTNKRNLHYSRRRLGMRGRACPNYSLRWDLCKKSLQKFAVEY